MTLGEELVSSPTNNPTRQSASLKSPNSSGKKRSSAEQGQAPNSASGKTSPMAAHVSLSVSEFF